MDTRQATDQNPPHTDGAHQRPQQAALAPVLAIAGPTASGKTAAALALAQHLQAQGRDCAIISVDSALVYRGMDIGTAKPSAQEQAICPHYLIDILEPSQAYSAADFCRDAQRLIQQLQVAHTVPILVGGTMLYFKALMQGLDDIPSAQPHWRAQLDAQAARIGWPAMHAQLAQVDAVTAARLSPNDSQRIQRALEVWHSTGKPLSHFHRRAQEQSQTQAQGTWLSMDGFFSLEPHDRAWLHQRIAQRFDAMLEAGFLHEVQRLRSQSSDLPPLHLGLPSMRCVGYRQAWQALDAAEALAASTNSTSPSQSASALPPALAQQLREQGIAATRQLAKRQITWLRSMPGRRIIACDQPEATQQLVQQAMQVLGY